VNGAAATGVRCSGCGRPLSASENGPREVRLPCPKCGSLVRTFDRTLGDGLTVEEHVDVLMASRPEVDLLAESEAQAEAAAAASADPGGIGRENRACEVATLCAHAALEAFINREGHDRANALWAASERLDLPAKWRTIVEHLTQSPVDMGSGTPQAIKRLCRDRNAIAHYKGAGIPGSPGFLGPPTPMNRKAGRVNVSPTRAHWAAALAARHARAVRRAMIDFFTAVGESTPEWLLKV
jgi:predicted RNA-binding Zn-ribbon protein involved in translation (DUF1610 family)